MSSHEEAVDMVNYYKQNPASLYGKPISFYLSKTLLVIEVRAAASSHAAAAAAPDTERFLSRPQKDERSADRPMDRPMDRPVDRLMDRPVREVKGQRSQVVFFSNLPREDEKKKELLTIARRFGVVEKHIFLTDQV